MKINLFSHPDYVLTGYTNICISQEVANAYFANDIDIIYSNKLYLNEYCDEGELEHLRAPDVINYAPSANAIGLIQHWLSHIRFGGSVSIGGIDFGQVCRSYMNRTIDMNVVNSLIFGNSPTKLSLIDLPTVVNTIIGADFSIISKKFDQNKFYVIAQRKQHA